jgi:hypothetical protein
MLNQRIQSVMGASTYSNYTDLDSFIMGENPTLLAAEAEEEGEEGLDAVIEQERITENDIVANNISEANNAKEKKSYGTFYQKYQPIILLAIGAALAYTLIKK